MIEIDGRDAYVAKKALAISILLIERSSGPFQSPSDQADMKGLLDRIVGGDVELEFYMPLRPRSMRPCLDRRRHRRPA
jgi:hypothetical protein